MNQGSQLSIYNYLQPVSQFVPKESESGSSVSAPVQIESKDEEVWKPVKDHPAWQISSLGQFKNQFGVITTPYDYLDMPYVQVTVANITRDVHRLVGEVFVPNPSNLPEIDHINHITKDNRAINLRWCTRGQNAAHQKKKTDKIYSSKWKGVCFDSSTNKWMASYNNTDKNIHYRQRFEYEILAALAYDNKVKEVGDLEFTLINNVEDTEEYKEFKKMKWKRHGHIKSSSRYYGVTKKGKKFVVLLIDTRDYSRHWHGTFKSEKDAARKYNEERIKLLGENCNRLNVVSDDSEEEEEEEEKEKDEEIEDDQNKRIKLS